jgi:hypothetical protein
MTLITFEDGKVVFRDGAVGTGEACCCGPSGECTADADCCYCDFATLTAIPTTEPNPADGFPGCSCVPDIGEVGNPYSFWSCYCLVPNLTCGDCDTLFPEYFSFFGGGFLSTGYCCNNQCYEFPCCEERFCYWVNQPSGALDPEQPAVGGWYLSGDDCTDERGDGDCACVGDPVDQCGQAPEPSGGLFEYCSVPCSKDNPLP